MSIEDDDDIDYEQLFDDHEITTNISTSEIKKSVKRVRFAPIIDDNSSTPTSSHPLSLRPTFEVQFDFDSLESPSIESNNEYSIMTQKNVNDVNWKEAFLTDLSIAKKNKPNIVPPSSIMHIDNETNEDTLWDFMKDSNPELLEKLERTLSDKQKRIDRFSVQQPTSVSQTDSIAMKSISVFNNEGIQNEICNEKFLCKSK